MGVFACKSVQGTFKVVWDVEWAFVVWDSPEHSRVSDLFHFGWQPPQDPHTPPPAELCALLLRATKNYFHGFQNCCLRFPGAPMVT